VRISAGATVRVLGMVFTATQLTLVAIAAVALAALHGLLRYTRLGKAMRATASDPELARNCGVQTRRVIDAAWLLSGLLCGPGWQVYNKDLLALSSVPKPAQWSTDSYTMTHYDSVIVMALAATAAKSTSPAVWNALIPAVTTPSPGRWWCIRSRSASRRSRPARRSITSAPQASSTSTSGTTRAAASRSGPTSRAGTSPWCARSRPPSTHLSSSKRPRTRPGPRCTGARASGR
jgi:hypothetical protein